MTGDKVELSDTDPGSPMDNTESPHIGYSTDPAAADPDDPALLRRVQAHMRRLCRRAAVPQPRIRVVRTVGRPPRRLRDDLWAGDVNANTRPLPRLRAEVAVPARAAACLSDAALDHLLAHEIYHSARFGQRRRRLGLWVALAGFGVLLLGLLATALLLQVPPPVASGAGIAAVATAGAAFVVIPWWRRGEEARADLFAVHLVPTMAGVWELDRWDTAHSPAPPRNPLSRLAAWVAATHPRRQERLAAMQAACPGPGQQSHPPSGAADPSPDGGF